MEHIIKYVTGVPLDKKPKSDKFRDIQKEYHLNKEYRSLNVYKDSLTDIDYNALDFLLTSDQYFSLLKDSPKPGLPYNKKISPKNEEKLIKLAEKAKAGKLRLTHVTGGRDLNAIVKTSENFMPSLKKVMAHKNAPSSSEAENYFLDAVKHKGKNAFSEFYANKKVEPISEKNKILVYVDDVLKGEITLAKKESVETEEAGTITTYDLRFKFGKKVKHFEGEDATWYSLEQFVDSYLRGHFLKEKNLRYSHPESSILVFSNFD
ncbi:MAG: hypothetical protein PHC66_02000 [Candidatus Nanoarchaeia archaeon]|nr:hypothetical protein [Candidatus Nanoarchaeia archaeon]MDD5239061.1 hypothetical protein [Candidatus Nanoarchaeia archaeon]